MQVLSLKTRMKHAMQYVSALRKYDDNYPKINFCAEQHFFIYLCDRFCMKIQFYVKQKYDFHFSRSYNGSENITEASPRFASFMQSEV